MALYMLKTIEPGELAEYVAFNFVGQDQAKALENLKTHLESGQTKYEHLYMLRSERGVEATFALGASPVVVPHARPDLSAAGQDFLAEQMDLQFIGIITLYLVRIIYSLCSLVSEQFEDELPKIKINAISSKK